MDDTLHVRSTETARDAANEGNRIRRPEPTALENRAQIFAFEPFHDQERPAVLGRAMRDVTDDRGMIEVREYLGFAREAIEVPFVPGNELDCHGGAGKAID